MVYDDRSNFVGDSHWRGDHAFAEGEEVELERRGILVEVSECVGIREQDLTSLLKIQKDRQERAHVRAVASSPPRPGPSIRTQTVDLPGAASTDLRSAKRRKPNNSSCNKNGYAQNLTSAALALSRTPSTTAPLHYDPLWLRTRKQPIEMVDMSNSDGIYRMPQERRVSISINQTKTGGSQAKRMSEKLSSARVNLGYAQNITGAALVLASKKPTNRDPPPTSSTARKETTRLGESGPPPITIEEDEFIDLDIYEKENQIEKALETSSQVIKLAKIRQQALLPKALSDQPHSETDRDERPFNPLRIRTRPKRKLLLTATLPSRPSSFTEPSVKESSGLIYRPTPPESGREPSLSLASVSHGATVSANRPFDIKVHPLSSSLNAEMDHHGTDALLTRKVLGQTNMAEKPHGNVQARTKNRNSTQSAEELREPTGLDDQERAQFTHIPAPQFAVRQNVTRSPRQPLMLCGRTDGNIEEDSVSI